MRAFLRSFIYAIHGLWSGIADQRNLKFQLGVAIVVVGAGFYLPITAIEWCIILLCIAPWGFVGRKVGAKKTNHAQSKRR